MKKFVVYGPPGTGKTTCGISLATTWLKTMAPEEIAYLAFTKAASIEAASRILGVNSDEQIDHERLDEEFPYFRTIHSLCYKLMSMASEDHKPVISTSHMKAFAEASGMEGSYSVSSWEDLADVYMAADDQGKTTWDRIAAAYNLSRLSCRTTEELAAVRKQIHPTVLRRSTQKQLFTDQYAAWVHRYEIYKAREGVIDFTDMLEAALSMPPVPVRRLVVDEVQDLCPLHFKIMEKLFYPVVEESWQLGDDDQSIFSWAGASADDFLDQAADATPIVLRQTHRFGKKLVDFAAQIISRVGRRMKKDVIGLADRENQISEIGEFKPFFGPALLLHRHVMGCQNLARKYIDAGIPFHNERGKSPLNARVRTRAFQALNDLADYKPVSYGQIAAAIVELVPTVHEEDGHRVNFLPRGAKKKLQEHQRHGDVILDHLVSSGFVLPDFVSVVKSRNWSLFKHGDDLMYYARLLKGGWKLSAEGAPIITTMHASKGREREQVVVFTEHSRQCWQNPDDEHRLAYVAVTRAQKDLTICADRMLEWATLPYEYPFEAPHARN